ncbi:MAG TPA: cytochrome c-type biogenesis protein CcmH [Hyphomicrobium zavarzinii]|nr:cytochrome c-type biogenesis protein CcmH [Hyphomicrobium zavarzinii]
MTARSKRSALVALLGCLLLAGAVATPVAPARAVTPQEMLPDKALEARARDISTGLRCLVCQNQSIDDSDAPLAHDLRVLVRERLQAGDTDAQVRDFVVARYGEFVLLKPPFSPETVLLWLMPLLVLLGAVVILRNSFRVPREAAAATSGREPVAKLTPEEQAALDALLKSDEPKTS